MPTLRNSEAHYEGRCAFLRGEMQLDCPYPPSSPEELDWQQGWLTEKGDE